MKHRFLRLLPPLPLVLPAVVSGVMATLCFPPVSAWPLGFVALVPLFVGLLRMGPGRKDTFKTVFLCGFVYYVTLMWWVARLLPSAGATLPWILVPATAIMASYLSLYPALGFVLVTALTRYRVAAFVMAAPAVWVIADLARTQGELSFPWGVIGYSLSDTPAMIQSASLFGLFGLTYLIVLTNALLAGIFAVRDTRLRAALLVAGVIVVGSMWGHGRHELGRWDANLDTDATVKTAIVQPNVDLMIKWKPEFKDSTLSLIDRLINEAAALDADFIVFPETCAPLYIDGRIQTFKRRLIALSKEHDAWIFIGFLNHGYNGPNGELNVYNSSGLFSPDGRLDKYDKNHLLPFGEQLPLSWKFRWIRKVDFGQSNFMPGRPKPPLEAAGTKYTPLICFESVFPYLCRRGVKQGSELLVNITNDGWFGDTPGARQHAQMCILRSVEFRRYLLRSANSGVSWVVNPAGRVITSLGLYEQGILTFDVPTLQGETFYCRFGDWPLFVWCLALTAVATVLARRRNESA